MTEQEKKARNREVLGKLFCDFAKTAFAAMVVTTMMNVFDADKSAFQKAFLFSGGTVVTSVLTYIGLKLLK